MTNGAIVENAICGIETIKKVRTINDVWAISFNFTGGIIETDGHSAFLNCKTAIKFYPYPLDKSLTFTSKSNFQLTSFKVDDNYIPLHGNENFINVDIENIFENSISLNGVDGLKFTSCSFENNFGLRLNEVADSLSNEHSLLVDAGDTEALNTDVQDSWPDETMEVRQELLDASPYLSDTVMISAAEKEDVLPNSILTEILVENPQSAKSTDVMNAVDSRNTLLTQSQYDQVMQGKLIAGLKEKLESQLSAAGSKRELALKNLVMAWHLDTLINARDSIVTLLQNEDRLSAKYALVEARLNTGDTVSANSVYQSIDTDFDLNSKEHFYWQQYNNWLNYRKKQLASGKPVSEPNSLQLISLYQLYGNTENQLKATIRNLLRYSDTLTYEEPYMLIDTSLKQSKVIYRAVGNNGNKNNELLVYPNPARTYLIIDYSQLNFDNFPVLLNIYTINGKIKETRLLSINIGFKVIDIRMWTPGTYIVSLKSRGELIGSKTIIVTQ